MKTVGIICEYNPLHLGHQKQLEQLRQQDAAVVCLMSGNFVQRGHPAIIDKSHRAKGAVLCGADLVLELPVTAALSSAEGFAAKGVEILGKFCDGLCFGAETNDKTALMDTAKVLLSEDFKVALRAQLDQGKSFPAARAAALGEMGEILATPNNILAVEYCKAILSQNQAMEPMPIHRDGSYHDVNVDTENPSATAVRGLMLKGHDWKSHIPEPAREIFLNTSFHSLSAGERAILGRLRMMTEAEFEAVPFGSEGLWRKLMHAARQEATLEQIATAVKSKRYTRTRIDRMILYAFLGLTQADMDAPIPYTRVLAFNDKGREILKNARKSGYFPNIGEKIDHPYQKIENQADALYGLFALDTPEPPESKCRVFYFKNTAGEMIR